MTYLRVTDLAARFSVNRSTIWRWCNTDPTFPKPVRLGPFVTRWKLSEIEAWEIDGARIMHHKHA
jgi:prophage regulatory protein